MDSIKNAIQICAGSSGLVWITMINNGYVDYTKNFLESVRINNIHLTLLVYCLDEESFKSLQSNSKCICVDARPLLHHTCPTSLSTWQTYDYKLITFTKLDVMKMTIQQASLLSIPYVGFIDMDIVLRKDPSEDALDCFKGDSTLQVIAACDEPPPVCCNISKCANPCSGTIVFSTSNLPSNLFEYTQEQARRMSCDQELLNNRFKELGMNVKTVQKPIWVNGVYPGIRSNPDKIPLPSQTSLIHFNYIIDKNYLKRETMKERGMWYLDPAPEAPPAAK